MTKPLPHLYPGAARWTVYPPDLLDGTEDNPDDWAVGLFYSAEDATTYGNLEWPGERLVVRELLFPSPDKCGDPDTEWGEGGGPIRYAGPTFDAKLADTRPGEAAEYAEYLARKGLTPWAG